MSAQAPLLPRRSRVLLCLFRLYLHWFFWRRFASVRVLARDLPTAFAGRKLVIYCNHPSWWDPALMFLALPKFFPARRGYGPMDATELQRYGLFRAMGIFGVDKDNPKAAAQFFRVARAVLQGHDGCLCVTAEGAFTDPRLRPIRLRRGLAHIALACPQTVFLPLAFEYSFWNESKPEALMAFGAPVAMTEGTSLESWHERLEQALTQTMDRLADASAARAPDAFRLVLRGTAGVGGPYDVWRRAAAIFRGRGFEARHEPRPPS